MRRSMMTASWVGATAVLATVASVPAGPVAASGTSSVGATLSSARLETVVELWSSTDATWRGDDLYITEQGGRVHRWSDGHLDEVLDISGDVRAEYEMGLLGLTFSPGGDRLYLNYSARDDHRTVVAEFPVAADGTIDLGGRRVVLEVAQPEENHNGGDLAFGPDGMLYIGMGDGGGYGDPNRTAQNTALLLGKMLRIDPAPSADASYSIPPDNPFVDVPGVAPEIWSLGLRNPWRFTFDSATGDLWIADVGEGEAEEVNAVAAVDGAGAGRGLNFGWSAFEGTGGFHGGLDPAEHTEPIYEYSHAAGGCSISGGALARGETAFDDWYVFADYCTGEITALRADRTASDEGATDIVVAEAVAIDAVAEHPVAVVASPDGDVLVLEGPRLSRLVVETDGS